MVLHSLSHLDLSVHVFMFHFWLVSFLQIWVPSNPRGAERLPPGIVAAESDFYLRRLWGLPHEVCAQTIYIYSSLSFKYHHTSLVICLFRIWPANQDTSWRLLLVLNRNKISMLVSERLVHFLDFCCFAIYDLLKVLSTVFRELHYYPVSLWRPSNWVGWVWMVQDCYTH